MARASATVTRCQKDVTLSATYLPGPGFTEGAGDAAPSFDMLGAIFPATPARAVPHTQQRERCALMRGSEGRRKEL